MTRRIVADVRRALDLTGHGTVTVPQIACCAGRLERLVKRDLDRAVKAGLVRQGVTGYWLPEQPDPGAIAVMERAIKEAE
jgi:hypothetical protein